MKILTRPDESLPSEGVLGNVVAADEAWVKKIGDQRAAQTAKETPDLPPRHNLSEDELAHLLTSVPCSKKTFCIDLRPDCEHAIGQDYRECYTFQHLPTEIDPHQITCAHASSCPIYKDQRGRGDYCKVDDGHRICDRAEQGRSIVLNPQQNQPSS